MSAVKLDDVRSPASCRGLVVQILPELMQLMLCFLSLLWLHTEAKVSPRVAGKEGQYEIRHGLHVRLQSGG